MKYLGEINDDYDLVNKKYVDGLIPYTLGSILPIGAILEWPSDIAPADWLICDGQAINRTEYKDLFEKIGTKYGSGNGSTTFNIPNKKGKVSVGKDENDTDYNELGKTGGNKSIVLTINNLPSHTHSFTGTSHNHTYDKASTSTGSTTLTINQMPAHHHLASGNVEGAISIYRYVTSGDGFQVVTTGSAGRYIISKMMDSGGGKGHTHTISTTSTNTGGKTATGSIGTTGSDQAVDIKNPYIVVNYIIKAKNSLSLNGYTEDSFEVQGDLGIDGHIILPSNRQLSNSDYGINMQNSDIINGSNIYMKYSGAIRFLKNSTITDKSNPANYDALMGDMGQLYYASNLIPFAKDLFYSQNEEETYTSQAIFAGHVTSSTTQIVFSIPTTKNMKNISTIAITAGVIVVRGISGYLQDSLNNPIPLTGGTYTITVVKVSNGMIRVTVNKDSAWSNVTNNTPLSVFASGLKLKFT